MTDIRGLLARNIRDFRREMGFTQAKLAEKAGIATHYIAMIEGGKNFPSPEVIERIAACLGKDSTDFFSINPIKSDWKNEILLDIERLIANRLAQNGKKAPSA
jgi:transcriptional regulator with XRE-family HTH domain